MHVLSTKMIYSDFDLLTIIMVAAELSKSLTSETPVKRPDGKGMGCTRVLPKIKLLLCSLYFAHVSGRENSGCKQPTMSRGFPSRGLSSFM